MKSTGIIYENEGFGAPGMGKAAAIYADTGSEAVLGAVKQKAGRAGDETDL